MFYSRGPKRLQRFCREARQAWIYRPTGTYCKSARRIFLHSSKRFPPNIKLCLYLFTGTRRCAWKTGTQGDTSPSSIHFKSIFKCFMSSLKLTTNVPKSYKGEICIWMYRIKMPERFSKQAQILQNVKLQWHESTFFTINTDWSQRVDLN